MLEMQDSPHSNYVMRQSTVVSYSGLPRWPGLKPKHTFLFLLPSKQCFILVIKRAAKLDCLCPDGHFSVSFQLEGHFCDMPDTQEEEEVEASLEGDMNKLAYCVTDVPPWYLCILLGIQVSRWSERSLTLSSGVCQMLLELRDASEQHGLKFPNTAVVHASLVSPVSVPPGGCCITGISHVSKCYGFFAEAKPLIPW